MKKPLGCKDISVRVHKGWLILIYCLSSTLVVLQYVKGKFFVKRSAVHLDRTTMHAEIVPVSRKYMMNTNHWLVFDVLPQYFLFFLKGVVIVARFQLMQVQPGILLKDLKMHGANNIIVPRWILYKESNNCVFVFVLASVASSLYPAAIVVQDSFDEFNSEFIWPTNY